MQKKIVDFGEKIGLARKDMAGGFTSALLSQMNEAEMKKFVTRDGVWPLPDAVKLVEDGADRFVVYWQRQVRRLTYRMPDIRAGESQGRFVMKCTRYTDQMNAYRKEVEAVRDYGGILGFYDRICGDPVGFRERFGDAVPLYELRSSKYELGRMQRKCDEDGFPGHASRKKGKRKPSFVPPQLERIEREGRDYRRGRNIDASRWQKEFNFRGVEFGNWMSQKDRQFSMNYAYDALRDLAYVLDIPDTDIAFNGQLALAFGARGCSHASAHYEPLREVINLTKLHGAGCTAHEWFHGLDDRLAKWCGITSGKLASEVAGSDKSLLPEAFTDVVDFLKFDKAGNMTDFYRGSRRMDKVYSRDSHGYWSSNAEMMARAFACYVKDTLGCKSDYLIAHADVYEFEFDNQRICAIPQGEEREMLDDLFDRLFYSLKENLFFSRRPATLFDEEEAAKPVFPEAGCPVPVPEFETGSDGQLRFTA